MNFYLRCFVDGAKTRPTNLCLFVLYILRLKSQSKQARLVHFVGRNGAESFDFEKDYVGWLPTSKFPALGDF